MLSDDWLLQYSRQIFLPEIDIDGQQQLSAATVMIIGVGGLGSPVAMYLASSGIGTIHLVEPDQVDITNLQRQIIYAAAEVEQPKVKVAKQRLEQLNPKCKIISHQQKFTATAFAELIPQVDVLIDCSDNFATRYDLNFASVNYKVPLVSGAAIKWQGQAAVYKGYEANWPCYQCVFGADTGDENHKCQDNGVVAPLVGMIGSFQALATIKLILGLKLKSELFTFNGLELATKTIAIAKDPSCNLCAS